MPRYKRTRDEAELDTPAPADNVAPEQKETLTRLRNMWEFASLMQYIFLFGHVVKIDEDFDIEDLEAECLKPTPSDKLAHIGLQLLKYVSSHRGLTPDIFDEYTRRQYVAKAPQRNPFGEDEDPIKFSELDIYTRIQILQQLSTWTFGNAERIRGLMPQDEDHLNWRMEPLGWDKEDRAYFVLDDNRLYRRADIPPPPPSPKPKAKSKSKSKSKAKSSRSRATRASKRRKVEDTEDEEPEEEPEQDDTAMDDTVITNGEDALQEEEPGYGFTSRTWECIAITLEEYQEFMASIFRSRDPNEKQLRARIEEDVLPIIEKRAEAIKQKQLKKLRELENLQKMATAKRSSRLADKADKEQKEREEREAEEKRQADLRMAREEQERQRRIEEGHESRRLTREQRVREREAKRILHEEELAKLEADGERAESQGLEGDSADGNDAKRASERQRKTQQEQHKKELQKLAEDDGNWYFDCSVCGKHGENMDDGTHSIACDRCNVWQHSECHGFTPKQAEHEDFTFICNTCKRKEEEAKKPKLPPLKLINRTSGSPEVRKSVSRPATANGQQVNNALPDHVSRQLDTIDNRAQPRPSPGPFGQLTSGAQVHGQNHVQSQPQSGPRHPPVGNFAPSPRSWQQGSTAYPPYNGYAPPVHQQQHQYAHQNAVASAGGHPIYYPQQSYTNGYPQYYNQQQQPQYQYQGPPHPPHQQQQQYHSNAQLMNGFQSPAKPSSSPPQRPAQSGPAQHQAPQLQQSPQTHLPPPTSSTKPQNTDSPVKASPQPAQYQSAAPMSPLPPPLGTQTPHASQQATHGRQQAHQIQTPQMARPVSSGADHVSSVAKDGMSGPWPAGSQAIPQKHDQSPAPPVSSHAIGEKKIFPPNTPLAPSPSQQAAAAAGSIPVKKMPELHAEAGATLPRPPSHPELEKQAQLPPQIPPPAQQ